jgi:hypothetical protein
MSATTKDPSGVYRQFIDFEERAAAIYLQFASHFSGDSQLSAFWFDMGIQEKQHAGLLQFCLADQLFAPDLPGRTEIQDVAALYKRLEKQAANPELGIEEAFTIAMELESSEINVIYRYLTTPLHKSPYLLRRKITTCLPDHVNEVLEAARKFGLKNGTLKELTRLGNSFRDGWKSPKRLRSAS